MEINKYISEIDSARFGFSVAKVNSFDKDPQLIVNELKKLGVKLILSKINAKDLKLINQLESLNFRLKDGQITYVYQFNKESNFPVNKNKTVKIRPYKEDDLDEIKEILKESFNNYGHYFADEKLNKKDCLDLYVDWGVKSCLNKKASDIVYVAEVNNEVAGLIAFRGVGKNEKKHAESSIGAVSSKFRGMSIFKLLLIEGLDWANKNKMIWAEHNVLITNFSVNSTFSSLEFKIKDSFYTFHCWL